MAYVTIEEKLRALSDCGFSLTPPFGIPDLVESWGREALDKPGFDLALVCLGMTEERPPWRPHCDTLWHFDTECIYGQGDYIRIAQRMAHMAQGSLALAELKDHVDIEGEDVWLSFTCKGEPVRIECEVNDDWVDAGVLSRFAELLTRHDGNRRYLYYDLGGQDCIVGCATLEQFERLSALIPGVEPLR